MSHDGLGCVFFLQLDARFEVGRLHDAGRCRRRRRDQRFQKRFDLGAVLRRKREEEACRCLGLAVMQGDDFLEVIGPAIVQIGR